MKARSALVYSVLRLLAFLVPFGILMLFPVMQTYYWLAAIFAALIGLSLSILFLRKPLDDVTRQFSTRPFVLMSHVIAVVPSLPSRSARAG